MPELPEEEFDERLRRLREYSTHARASDDVLPRIRAAIEHEHPSIVRRPVGAVMLAAAAVLIAVGFAGGRLTAPASPAIATSSLHPAIAVQESGTRLVTALDALSAMKDSAPASIREQSREVTLVALGAVLAAGSAEYPDEVDALLLAARSPRQENTR
jgi:hypothetical protein